MQHPARPRATAAIHDERLGPALRWAPEHPGSERRTALPKPPRPSTPPGPRQGAPCLLPGRPRVASNLAVLALAGFAVANSALPAAAPRRLGQARAVARVAQVQRAAALGPQVGGRSRLSTLPVPPGRGASGGEVDNAGRCLDAPVPAPLEPHLLDRGGAEGT